MSGFGPYDKTLLCVMAHSAAQPSIDEFLPKWEATGFDLFCALPHGDDVTGFQKYFHAGESAHSGAKVFRRFIDTAIMVRRQNCQRNVIIEYDTVPLRPEPLPIYEGAITSGAVVAFEHCKNSGPKQLCALSPWAMTHGTLCRFIDAMEDAFAEDFEGERFCGLLDRWLGWVIESRGLLYHDSKKILPYPYFDGVHEKIRRCGHNWIHGWKRKADFGNLF